MDHVERKAVLSAVLVASCLVVGVGALYYSGSIAEWLHGSKEDRVRVRSLLFSLCPSFRGSSFYLREDTFLPQRLEQVSQNGSSCSCTEAIRSIRDNIFVSSLCIFLVVVF